MAPLGQIWLCQRERDELGQILDREQSSRSCQLVSSRRAARDGDRRHSGRDGRLHVPDCVAYVAAPRRLDLELAGGKEEQIWSRLGMLDIAAVDDDWAPGARQCLDRRVDLFAPTRGRDRPWSSPLLEGLQQLEGAGERLRVEIQLAVNFAGAAIDFLLSIGVQG